MRRVTIIDQPDKPYPYAAIDRQTGEIPLRHHALHRRDLGVEQLYCDLVKLGESR
jgi:hypothetical protein